MSLSVDRALRKAKRHVKKGEVDLAAQMYKSVLEKLLKNKRATDGLKALQQTNTVKTATNAEPSQGQINRLIALYNQGKLQQSLAQSEALAKQFPNVPFIANLLGVVNASLGRLEEAVASYTKALQIKSDYAEAHYNLGVALKDLGKPEEAVASYHKALQIKPDYVEAHYNLGVALKDLGKLEEAVVSYHKALQFKPDFAEAYNNLANALNDLGKPEEAVANYHKALRIKPDYGQAHNNLANALKDLGKPEEAVANYRKALQIKPDFAEAHNNLGVALKDLGKLEEAVASYHKALQIEPDFAEAHYNLANALNDLGKPEEAVASYHKALRIKPDYGQAHNNLANALRDLGKPEEAVASYRKALQIKPDFVEAHYNLGVALKDLGKLEEAVVSYHKALQIEPDHAEAYNNLANALNDLGKPEEAVANYHKALQIKPDYAEAHRNLSTVKKYRDDDPQIHQMLELVERTTLPDEARMHLNFALGKAHGDIGDHDTAFLYLFDGNCLRKEELRYETSSSREEFAKIKTCFSENLSSLDVHKEPDGGKGQQPIFILGMPRSGTTLVEQILASHSQVYGAGELALLSQAVGTTEWKSTQLSSDQIQSIRKSYFSGLTKIGASEPYITDKAPSNFRWIGFIFAAIPEAKIIHVKRDACATCWSNYKHYFPYKGIGFAYDLQDVAEYYKMYIDLMAFWHEKYPRRIYDLSYEALTEHQENETQKLLKHVGLDWENQCVEFHETKRVVQTASATQVRQKMYQGSSEEWRKYEKHLQPMIELLRGL